ncbi:MAG: pilus assembly protein PilM [Planctomycetes bacterium]|jgi:type IV pilus assembly protein PilM|nr:pilus assembly protein PilM [Planctomycetota bacterium]
MARTITGVDIGTRSNKYLRGQYKGNTFHVSSFAYVEHAPSNLAGAWSASDAGFKLEQSRVGVTGRDVNLRYTRVPQVPDWQLKKLMRFEVEEIGGQSGSEVASDFNVLPPQAENEGEDVVLLAMARESILASHLEGLAGAGGALDAFSPNALALYNAWLRYGVIEDDTILLANIGHENVDVILVRGADLLFARNLTGGAKLIDDAIAERFGVSAAKAEELKRKIVDLTPGVKPADAMAEKATRSASAPAGALLSLLQSTVMFCKSQVKLTSLRVDRVLLCGGGAQLKGLSKFLSNGMNVPVDLFDPFRVVETGALDPDGAASLEEHRLESVIALGLATMASDPNAYSVEILPAALRKRREFMGGTLWMIVAAAVAVAYLGWYGFTTRKQLESVRTTVSGLEAREKRAKAVDKEARELIVANEKLAVEAFRLQSVAGSGEQLARSLWAVAETIPSDFWLSQASSEWRFNENLRVPRGEERPILHMEGRSREGTSSPAQLFAAFVAGVATRLAPAVAMTQNPSPSFDKFTLDLTLFAPEAPVAAAEEKQP